MKTNLREWLTRYRCFIRPKVHFAPKFSFNITSISHYILLCHTHTYSVCIIRKI